MLSVTNKPITLSVTYKPFMLSVLMLNVIVLNVVAPKKLLKVICWAGGPYHKKLLIVFYYPLCN